MKGGKRTQQSERGVCRDQESATPLFNPQALWTKYWGQAVPGRERTSLDSKGSQNKTGASLRDLCPLGYSPGASPLLCVQHRAYLLFWIPCPHECHHRNPAAKAKSLGAIPDFCSLTPGIQPFGFSHGVAPLNSSTCVHCSWFPFAHVSTANTTHKAKRQKQCQCPSADEWMNKMCQIHTIEYYSSMKKEKVLTHASTWMGLENTMLSEQSQTPKVTYYIFHKYKIMRQKHISGCQGQGKGEDEKWLLNGYRVSLWGDETFRN